MKKKIVVAVALVLVGAIIGQTVSYALELVQTKKDVLNQNDIVEIVQDDIVLSNDSYIGETKAKSIAFNHVGVNESDATKVSVTFDYDDGVAEYEVDFYVGTTEYDFEIHAYTGEITGYDSSVQTTSATSNSAITSQDYIGETKAKSIAFNHAGVNESDATKVSVTFDYGDGVAEYEVEWKVGLMEYDYEINAYTGEVISHNVEMD